MGVTNYYTVDGQMIGYKDANGRKDFLTDNLGSVTAEIDQTGTNRTFDGRYRPYGNSLWSTGTRGAFGWVGTWGYRSTGLSASTHYIRARHYSQANGSWTTVDPIWPNELAYTFVIGRPTYRIDYSGTSPCQKPSCDCKSECSKLENKHHFCDKKYFPPDTTIGAYAFCCNGKPCYCECDYAKNEKNQILKKCLEAHETAHCPPGCCDSGFTGPCKKRPDRGTECAAQMAEIRCLWDSCPRSTISDECNGADKRRKDLCDNFLSTACHGKIPDGFKEKYCS